MHSSPALREGKLLRASFALIITLILSLCFLLFRQAGSWQDQQQWVEHSYLVRVRIEALDRSLREAESTQRAMLLFENRHPLELRGKYEAFRNDLRINLQRLRSLVRDNPSQLERVEKLAAKLAIRTENLERNIDELRHLGSEERQARIEIGVAQSEEVDVILDGMREDEARLLTQRTEAARQETRKLLAIAGIGSAAGVLVLLFTFILDQKNRRLQRAYQEKLAAARDLALDSVKTTSNFVASVSHEIRTPMNGIMGASDLLRIDRRLGKEQLELVDVIRRSSAALLALINDILDLSKLQAGKMDFVRDDFVLIDLLDEVLALFTESAGRKQLELTYRIEPEVPRLVQGDANRLRQVLVNLVGNAVKFTDAGSVMVNVSRVQVEDFRPVLRFRVSDTGPGMSEDDQTRLFQPFSRVNPALAAKHDGTGLGLAISREIVQRMEGSMGVESIPDKGSTFWFTVRLHEAMSPNRPSGRLGSGGTVLLIEGRENTAKSIGDHLEAWGLKPEFVQDLAILDSLPEIEDLFAVIIGQPLGASWKDATTLVSKRPDAEKARVLVMALPGKTSDPEELQRLGIHGSLRYPFRPSDLYNQLTEEPREEDAAGDRMAEIVKDLPPARILLVEDNPVNQRIFARQLQALGLEVDICSDGTEGVEARKADTAALVLMDCQLPVMDGFEATRRIRKWEEAQGHPRIPIIAVTAHVMVGDAEECFQAGMDDYLPKPFDLARLRQVLGRWLKAGPARGEASASDLPAAEPEPVDFEQLSECLAGDEEADQELLGMAFQEASDRIAEMRGALAAGDDNAWRRAAHRGRGSSATVGFAALSSAFAACEHDTGMPEERLQALEDLEALLGFTRRILSSRSLSHEMSP